MKLSREQRRLLFDGECPPIEGDGICPVEVGYVLELSSRLSLEVLEVRRKRKGGWSLHYLVTDMRDTERLLRRTPPAHDVSWMVKDRKVPLTKAEQAEADRQAALESAYTSSHGRSAITDAGEAVDKKTQDRISGGGMSSDGQKRWDRTRTLERQAVAVRSPEEQLRAELEALRAEQPDAAFRYEAQVVRLTGRIEAKRRRKAA